MSYSSFASEITSISRITIHQDSITGLLLAGIGHINDKQRKNFLVVDSSGLSLVFVSEIISDT